MASSTLRFLTEHLLDRELGGVYRATDPAGRRVLSTDKHLPDQSSAVLALAARGGTDDLRVALEGLLGMQDRRGHPGFVELADRSWRVDPAGDVRSVRFQFHAGAALLAAAFRLEADELRVQAVDLLDRLLCTGQEARFPNQLSADWRTVLDATDNPQTAVAAVRALAIADSVGETTVDFGPLPAIAQRLCQLVESSGVGTVPPELRRCGAAGRIAVALTQAGRMLDSAECFKAAQAVLGMVTEYFADEVDGGFWDRVGADGTVRADWLGAPQHGLPPFPIKRTSDTAQLLLAGRLLTSCGIEASELVAAARSTIETFVDTRHGGVFLGAGYSWLSPVEPAAPSSRQPWPAPRHPGLAYESGQRHLALHQKSAHANASVVQACGDDTTPAVRPVAAGTGRTADLTRRVPDIARFDVSPLGPRLGGCVPDVVEPPGGAVAWQVTPAYHATANLRLLAGSAPAGLPAQVLAAQDDDGGFGEQPGDLPDLSCTCRAVVTARLVHRWPARPAAAAEYVRACRGADGGYGAVPGSAPDLWHTGLALTALRMLAAEVPANADFVLACHSGSAGYGRRPGLPPDVLATRSAVSALTLLGRDVPAAAGEVAWLRRHQAASGGFAHRIGGPVSLGATYHAVAALAVLGSAPVAVEACVNWLLACRDSGVPGGPLALTGEDDFACLQALALLDGTCDGDWALAIA